MAPCGKLLDTGQCSKEATHVCLTTFGHTGCCPEHAAEMQVAWDKALEKGWVCGPGVWPILPGGTRTIGAYMGSSDREVVEEYARNSARAAVGRLVVAEVEGGFATFATLKAARLAGGAVLGVWLKGQYTSASAV